MPREWTRYVVPAGSEAPVDEAGFLVDPEHASVFHTTREVTRAEEAFDSRVLVLLGEPGSGKSTILRAHHSTAHEPKEYVDLGERATSDDIRSAFRSEIINAWKRGEGELTLTLDGLDESLQHVETAARVIATEIVNLPRARLQLRIGCRAAEWDANFERRLRELWSGEVVRVVELCPLARRDAREAIEYEGFDADVFLAGLGRSSSLPLATQPITLRLLLETAVDGEPAGSTRGELYSAAAHALASEPNTDRQEFLPEFTTGEILSAARRIAAVMMLCAYGAVRAAPNGPDAALAIEAVSGPDERDRRRFAAAIRTALFTAGQRGTVVFWHHTFAERLAAEHLAEKHLGVSKLEQLLTIPLRAGRRVAPNLRGVAAWLAAEDASWLKVLAAREPEVALMGDVSSHSDETKRVLVDLAITKLGESPRLSVHAPRLLHLSSLEHPAIDEQLRNVITDAVRTSSAREAAIIIAHSCRLDRIMPDIARVALDEGTPEGARQWAAACVGGSANEDAKRALAPLADGSPTDPNLELKGTTLTALWPDHLSAAELVTKLEPPPEAFFGAYFRFLLRDLPQGLTTEALPALLDWAARDRDDDDDDSTLDRTALRIVAYAWENMDDAIAALVAKVAVKRLKGGKNALEESGDGVPPHKVTSDERRRRVLVRAMLPLLDEADGPLLTWGRPSLVLAEDVVHWVAGMPTLPEAHQRVIAQAIRRAADWNSHEQLSLLYHSLHVPALAAALKEFQPIPLDSEEARRLQDTHAQQLAHERELARMRAENRVHDAGARTREWLAKSEAGEEDGWWRLNLMMLASPNGIWDDLEANLDESAGWRELDPKERNRVVAAAARSLERPAAPDVLRPGVTPSRTQLAEWRALRLIQRQRPDLLREVPSATWAHAGTLLIGLDLTDDASQVELIRLATPHAEADIARLLSQSATSEGDRAPIGSLYRAYWTPAIAQAVAVALAGARDTRVVRETLRILAESQRDLAAQTARSLIAEPIPATREGKSRALGAIQALVSMGLDWDRIWLLARGDETIADHVIEALGGGPELGGGIESLREPALADLYAYLHGRFPPEHDPGFRNGLFRPRIESGLFRDGVLRNLASRGTPEALTQIEALETRLGTTRLRYVREDLEENVLKASWQPLAIEQLDALATRPGGRLVRSRPDLRQAVRESLERYQEELRSATPAAADLYSVVQVRPRILKPKPENDLSDHLKRFLERDLKSSGIIANREVEVQRGQREDIRIDAVAEVNGRRDRITLVVEVKGCWNLETLDAVQRQLVDQYLRPNDAQDGLMVVFCFHRTPVWAADDPRRGRWHKDDDLTSLQGQLDMAARQATCSGFVVEAIVIDGYVRA